MCRGATPLAPQPSANVPLCALYPSPPRSLQTCPLCTRDPSPQYTCVCQCAPCARAILPYPVFRRAALRATSCAPHPRARVCSHTVAPTLTHLLSEPPPPEKEGRRLKAFRSSNYTARAHRSPALRPPSHRLAPRCRCRRRCRPAPPSCWRRPPAPTPAAASTHLAHARLPQSHAHRSILPPAQHWPSILAPPILATHTFSLRTHSRPTHCAQGQRPSSAPRQCPLPQIVTVTSGTHRFPAHTPSSGY